MDIRPSDCRMHAEERRYDAHCGPVGAEGESGGASIEDRVPRIRTTEALLAEPLARKRHVGGGMRRLHRGEEARATRAVRHVAPAAYAAHVGSIDDLEVLNPKPQISSRRSPFG